MSIASGLLFDISIHIPKSYSQMTKEADQKKSIPCHGILLCLCTL